MKNIHLLSTDKPSRLAILDGILLGLYPDGGSWFPTTKDYVNRNLYITSEQEQIKEGDWHLHYYANKTIVGKSTKDSIQVVQSDKGYKKVVLTTDETLIKEGVQAISNEFLQWYVKNPTCEYVEVIKHPQTDFVSTRPYQRYYNNHSVVIPQVVKSEEEFLGVEFTLKDGSKEFVPKQETVEEAAENSWSTYEYKEGNLYQTTFKGGFIAGAKYQAERMYTEEEVLDLLNKREEFVDSVDNIFEYRTIKEWFEQFKKP